MAVGHLLLALAAPALAEAANWAVIAAGSNGWSNYRHQADACHAYQIMRAKGIPEENIILMAYDDIANSSENPFPGQIFNVPDHNGTGMDVYHGCKIDYRGDDVNIDTYLSIITGEGSGKVLKSTEEDHVFLNFLNHGAPGLISFPKTEMHKDQLQSALAKMHSKKMFKRLVFYLETCESGSMFEDMKTPGVYALSAASPYEPSWGAFCNCDVDDKANGLVNGKCLNTCLGDVFSVNWMQNTQSVDITNETLQEQFEAVHKLTTKSKVMQWGDKSFTSDKVSQYLGKEGGRLQLAPAVLPGAAVRSYHIALHLLYRKYEDTWHSSTRLETGGKLQAEMVEQQTTESVYRRLAEIAYPDDAEAQHKARTLEHNPNHMDCELEGHKAIRESCADKFDANSAFALSFHQVIVNICADIAEKGLNLSIRGAAELACGKERAVVV